MNQKVIITKDSEIVDELILQGWRVVSITAQFVSVSTSANSYANEIREGKFCFLLEKTET